jgi:hypothetical protein
MSSPEKPVAIQAAENELAQLESLLLEAKGVVQSYVESNSRLSRSAAEERARNQGAGRGFLSGFLGSKYRGVMRASAAASNASIAADVAQKRTAIADGKIQAQEVVRNIQAQLAGAKSKLKSLNSEHQKTARKKPVVLKDASETLDLLKKLKQAHSDGLLTDDEFDAKRKKLAEGL